MPLQLNVNSYVTVEEAEDYFSTRIDAGAWHNADAEDKESSLVTATQLIDNFEYVGAVASLSQELAWPRLEVVYYSPKAGQYLAVPSDEVPSLIVNSVFELALHLLANENMLNAQQQTFEKIQIGPISISDSSSDYKQPPLIPQRIKNGLKPLLVNTGAKTWWRAN